MRQDESWGVVGRRCVGVTRIIHKLTGQPPTPFGPLELAWETGEVTLLDVNTDWTLQVSATPWTDPYAGRSQAELEVVGREVGLWERCPADSDDELDRVVGARATTVEPLLNRFAELVGLNIDMDEVALRVRVDAGDLVAHVERTLEPPRTRSDS